MWKNTQKLISLSKIHAPDARYLLSGLQLQQNPSNYISSEAEASNTFNLASVTYSLMKESEKLQSYIESKECARQQPLYQGFKEANGEKLQRYISKLTADIKHDSSLPIHLLTGFAFVSARNGTLTAAYFDSYLRERILAKLQYASLVNLIDLNSALLDIDYDRSSEVAKASEALLAQKLQVGSS
jgi:hypothetical protein